MAVDWNDERHKRDAAKSHAMMMGALGSSTSPNEHYSDFRYGQQLAGKSQSAETSGEGMAFLFAFILLAAGLFLAFLGIFNVLRGVSEWAAYFSGDAHIMDIRDQDFGFVHRYDRYFRYSSTVPLMSIIAVLLSSIVWIYFLLRSLSGERLTFILFSVFSLMLVTSSLTLCDLETACKANVVAFDRGDAWYLPSRDGAGWGALFGAGWILGGLVGLRLLIQKTRLRRFFERIDATVSKRQTIELILSVVFLAFAVPAGLALTIIPLTTGQGYIYFALTAGVSLLILSCLVIMAVMKRASWWIAILFLPVALLLSWGARFYHLYDECSDMQTRAGYELLYDETCAWHKSWNDPE